MDYRTLLVEDQRLFRSLLANHLSLQTDFRLVGQAADGLTGWRLYQELKPDLILLDIVIPEMDGFDLAQRILADAPTANILAITSQMDRDTTNRIFQIGFKGYVEKEQPIEVLHEAMLAVAEGGLYFTQLVRENRFRINSEPAALQKIMSDRECQIIREVAGGYSNQEIADRLNLSRRTVENHRYRILKKLNLESTSQLISFAFKNGLMDV
jgi:NarL family two-component system response regulator LiaR